MRIMRIMYIFIVINYRRMNDNVKILEVQQLERINVPLSASSTKSA